MIPLASPNHEARPPDGTVDMLVIHYTGMPTAEAALERLCDPAAKVSAHYVVDEDGTVYQLVAEDRRAWHAGVSCWRGERDVNSRSIGIELVNPGHEFGYRSFPEAQMQALRLLTQGILARHPIPPHNVVGHSDVAPRRKQDPGELFDWQHLASWGIGLWPFGEPACDGRTAAAPYEVGSLLARCGYDVASDAAGDLTAVITAFQRHYRPHQVDGLVDGETLQRLQLLAALGEFAAG